jgi:hypothetical protein
MPAILAHSPVQLVAQLITRAHHSERIPTKPLDRKDYDARIRDTDDEIKRCLWAFGMHAGVEL